MNKNYYLLIGLLLSGLAVPVYLQAKPISSHTVSSIKTAQNQQSNADSSEANTTQDDSVSLPKINQIQFSGNTVIPSSILQKAIPLKENDIANEYNIMDSMVKIADLYKEKKMKVTITPKLEKVSINSRKIIFQIHEKSSSN